MSYWPSLPLGAANVVEVDGFKFPWDPDHGNRRNSSGATKNRTQPEEPIVVDKLRNRFYYNSKGKRNPDSNYVDCQEEERGGIIPDFQDPGEWRYISTKLKFLSTNFLDIWKGNKR